MFRTRMATFYRIVSSHRAATALDGEGARKMGGRWNPPGMPVAYLTTSRALAALEIMVHFGRDVALASWCVIEVQVPDDLSETISKNRLPKGWNDLKSTAVSQKFGAKWAVSKRSLALILPSTIIPEENIMMLNVLHPDFSKIKASAPVPFRFDPRL